MTTIAVKDGIMAADSRQISAYINPIKATKMYKVCGVVIGASGDTAHILSFVQWFEQGRDESKWPALTLILVFARWC